MRKILFSLLLLLSAICFSLPQSSHANDEYTYIISFETEVNQQVITSSGATVVETLNNSPIAIVTANENAVLKLQDAKGIKAIERNEKIKIAAQTVNWGIKPMKAPLAWQTGYTGQGVKVAIIDSGVGPHDDLNVVEKVSFVEFEPSTTDYNGHGTHIAGIIAAIDNEFGVKGIAPDANLYALKVFDKHGKGNTHDVIRAIDWAIDHDMDIINLSLTSETGLSSYEDLLNRAYQKGILIVGAAGNSTETDARIDNVKYPARYKNVIAVSSIDKNGEKGYFSSIGPAVEVAAPGVNIYSTYANNSYSTLQGTSLATAFVTGHLALLKEAYPNLTNVQLRKLLVDNILDLGPTGRDPVFGYGLIQTASYTSPLYEYPAAKNPVTDLTFSTKHVIGEVEDTIKVGVEARFKNGEKIDVSDFARWTSNDPQIASSRSGRIDLHREGETSLQADYGGLTIQLSVKVDPSSSPSISEELPYTDIPKDFWATDEIQEVYKKLIITGYEDRTFRPGNPIQRQHVAAMVARSLNLEKKIAFSPFLDVTMDSPYYYDIMKTQQAGIFSGDKNRFEPRKTLSRAQMSKIIVEAFNIPKAQSHPFPDVIESHWANEYIAALYEAGITTGSDGKYNPEKPVTRTQFAAFISRALNQ